MNKQRINVSRPRRLSIQAGRTRRATGNWRLAVPGKGLKRLSEQKTKTKRESCGKAYNTAMARRIWRVLRHVAVIWSSVSMLPPCQHRHWQTNTKQCQGLSHCAWGPQVICSSANIPGLELSQLQVRKRFVSDYVTRHSNAIQQKRRENVSQGTTEGTARKTCTNR